MRGTSNRGLLPRLSPCYIVRVLCLGKSVSANECPQVGKKPCPISYFPVEVVGIHMTVGINYAYLGQSRVCSRNNPCAMFIVWLPMVWIRHSTLKCKISALSLPMTYGKGSYTLNSLLGSCLVSKQSARPHDSNLKNWTGL